MNWILGLLFPEGKVRKQINSILRKLILATAVLISEKVPVLSTLAEYLTTNVDSITASVVAVVMAGLAVIWGTEEKKS